LYPLNTILHKVFKQEGESCHIPKPSLTKEKIASRKVVNLKPTLEGMYTAALHL